MAGINTHHLNALRETLSCPPTPTSFFLIENELLGDRQVVYPSFNSSYNYIQCGTSAFYGLLLKYSPDFQTGIDHCFDYALKKIFKQIDSVA